MAGVESEESLEEGDVVPTTELPGNFSLHPDHGESMTLVEGDARWLLVNDPSEHAVEPMTGGQRHQLTQ